MLRKLNKLSQRDFAEKLTAKGMPVDASAVSRIEKGTRSVRLTEALTIAEVLDVDLDWLVSGSKTPAQELRAMRRDADRNLRLLIEPVNAVAWSLVEVSEHLNRYPELLAELSDEKLGTPSSAGEYLGWVARRIGHWPVDLDDYVDVASQDRADQIIEVITSLARHHVGLSREESDLNGEHQEEA